MKKFIIALSVLVLLFMALDAAHYRLGWYIDLMPEEPVTTFGKDRWEGNLPGLWGGLAAL